MLKIFFTSILMGITGCDLLSVENVEAPTPHKIEQVVRCNKYGTCVVVFANGKQGLMTRPNVGEYGCKSMSDYAYNRCDGP